MCRFIKSLMMSLNKNFLFIHIPKTGGNSIASHLKDHSEDDILVVDNALGKRQGLSLANNKYKWTNGKHTAISEYYQKIGYEKCEKMLKFAVFRNVFDRIVSSAAMSCRSISEDSLWGAIHTNIPMEHYIVFQNFVKLNFFIDFMNIVDDFSIVAKIIGVGNNLPHMNRSRHGVSDMHLTNNMIEAITNKFSWEINRFGMKIPNSWRRF